MNLRHLAPVLVALALPASAQAPKSLADGLVLDGSVGYFVAGGNVTLTAGRIRNDSTTRATGALRLELWASASRPARGAAFTGMRLATANPLGAMPPISVLANVRDVAAFAAPSDGTYWIVMVLAEQGLPGCPAADGFCQSDSIVFSTPATFPAPVDYTDLWWNPAEPGWGVSIIQHESGVAFVVWFTYDEAGRPKWFVAPDCRIAGAGCTSTLYETTGPPASAATFDASKVGIRIVGSLALAFRDAGNGTMNWRIDARQGTKSITRQSF